MALNVDGEAWFHCWMKHIPYGHVIKKKKEKKKTKIKNLLMGMFNLTWSSVVRLYSSGQCHFGGGKFLFGWPSQMQAKVGACIIV